MNSLISVVIPVFNTKKYLLRCIESIQAQTHQNWEAILLDDGSSDGSELLCDEITQKDARFRVIHQVNSGLSAARNAGITAAKGEFICFVDSDDYVFPTYLETLIAPMKDPNNDLSIVGIVDKYSDTEITSAYSWGAQLSYEEFFSKTLLGELPGSCCNRLYRLRAIEKIRFRIGKYYEDSFFTVDCVGHLRAVAVNTEPLYVYYHRESSITTEPYSERALDVIKAAEYAHHIASIKAPEALASAKFRCISSRFVVLDRIVLDKHSKHYDVRKALVSYLRAHLIDVLRMNNFHWTRKISAIILYFSTTLYTFLVQAKTRSRSLG